MTDPRTITPAEIMDSICMTQMKDMSYADGARMVSEDIDLLQPTAAQSDALATALERLMRDEREDYENVEDLVLEVNGRIVRAFRATPCHVSLSVDGETISTYATDVRGFGY